MCGIYGIVSKQVIPFDKRMFCTLGINNDSRGGDSCGIFIDGAVEYGIDKRKYFIDFMIDSELLHSINKCRCAIGHDRKASVGGVSLEAAQPVTFKNADGNIDFVVIHNGTIHNYLDLADKYIPDIDCEGMTDSQVMATIFYNAGYDCLSEYQGGAVFFIVDYRNGGPHYYAWRGESKKTSYCKDTEDKEERPFFFTYGRNSVVFSSISTYLYVISKDVYILPANTLIEFIGTNMYTVEEYPRDKVDQSGYRFDKGREKKYTSPTSAYGGTGSANVGGRRNDDWYDDDYARWESYWESNDDGSCCDNSRLNNNQSPSFQVYRALDDEKDRELVNVQYDNKRDLYINNEKLCHGEYSISMYGYGPGYSGNKSNPKHYFWCGVHLASRECFEFLSKMMSHHRLSEQELLKQYDNLVHYLSGMPYKLNNDEKGLWVFNPNYYSHDTCKEIDLKKCFDGRIMHIKDGICVGLESNGYPKNYSDYKDRIKLVIPSIDFGKLKTIYLP